MRLAWLGIALSLPLSANAFTLLGLSSQGSATTGWKKTTLQYVLNTSGCSVSSDSVRSAVSESMALWNGVSTARLTLENSGDSTISATSATSMSTVTGVPPIVCFTSSFGSVDPAVTLGVSAATYNTSTMEIVQSYLALNSVSGANANISTLSTAELTATLAHEMGHSVGLGHSEDTTALMYFQNLRERARLGTDDADGYTFLYPRSELTGGGFMGCGTLTRVSEQPPHSGATAVISVFALFAFCFAVARLIGRTNQSDALTSST
jgi:hypothetical protein